MSVKKPLISMELVTFDDVEEMNANGAEQSNKGQSTPKVNGDSVPTVEPHHPIQPTFVPSGIILPETTNKPLNEPFPIPQLGKAQIYMPVTLNKEMFKKEDIIKADENGKMSLAVVLYRKLIDKYIFRAYQGEIYLFIKERGIYEKKSDLELDYLINENFGCTIERQDSLRLYYEIKEYLKKRNDLVVKESGILPLHYWEFENGFCDIYNGTNVFNDGRYFIRNVLQCSYNPNAVCPIFDKFIESISGGDSNIITLLWETIGYLLSNDMNGKVFFAFIGKKDTGKSLLAHIIKNIVGDSATSYLSANDFNGRFAVSELRGKKLNICMDLPNLPFSEETVGTIKSITGRDVKHADVKYKEPIHFIPTTRLLYGSNSLIRTKTPDTAFNERMVTIPFRFAVPKSRMDFDLEDKLLSEREGICIKAMLYYKEIVRKKYQFSRIVFPEEDIIIDESKVIEYFAKEYCVFTGLDSDKVFSNKLFVAYQNYCYLNDITPLRMADFSKKFNEIYCHQVTKKKIKIANETLNGFTGIRLSKVLPDNPLNV